MARGRGQLHALTEIPPGAPLMEVPGMATELEIPEMCFGITACDVAVIHGPEVQGDVIDAVETALLDLVQRVAQAGPRPGRVSRASASGIPIWSISFTIEP